MKTRRQTGTCLGGITLAIALNLIPAATLWADSPKVAAPPPSSMAAVQSAYGHLPLSFEANQGQVDPRVQFLSRRHGHTLFLTPSEAVLTLRKDETEVAGREGKVHQDGLSSSPPATSHSVVRMKFDGANPHAEMVGLDKLPGIVNYLIDADPSKWRTNIPTYKKVEYKNVYAGIDLAYYGNQGQLEYDLIVAPGADPNLIRLVFDGAEKVEVDPATGDLVLALYEPSANSELRTKNSDLAAGATLRLNKPVVYQRDERGEKHLLAGTYVLVAAETSSPRPMFAALHASRTPHVAFQVSSYDASQPLVIDPVLSWATYLGGSGDDVGYEIAVDPAGNAYVTGYTVGGFPGTAGSLIQSTYGGGLFYGSDAFVTKLNAAGTALVYSTYLGGSGDDIGIGITVDPAGNAYVTGQTSSSNFPGTAGSPIQSKYAGSSGFSSGGDGVVAKITTNVPFAAFRAKAEIDLHHRPHEDEFEMTAIFTLGPNNNGIAPLTEALIVQVGSFSTAIPAGSFKRNKGRFTFEGVINGVKLEAVLRSLILGNDYEFKVEGKGADFTGRKNPVTVGLTIGTDSGSKPIKANFE